MAEEKGRVLLFGRRWSGRTTLANMLVSGEIGDCPLNPTDIDSICKTYVGRGWTVIDTMGFGEPLDDIAPDEYATEMGINFLNEMRGSYSHIIFVLDGRDVEGNSRSFPSGIKENHTHILSMWKIFLEIFRGGEERFVILVTKVTPQKFTRPSWATISQELVEGFPECKHFLCSNFFNEGGGDDGEEAVVLKGDALEKLEKEMEEMCEGRPWVEPNVANMGEDEIKEMAARITHRLTSSSVGDPEYDHINVSVDSIPPSLKAILKPTVKTILKVRDKMENLGKEVKFYPQQCEYLLKRTKEAANEIHELIYGNEMNFDPSKNQWIPLKTSLCRVLHCMKVGKKLLQHCAEGVNEEFVLAMTSRTNLDGKLFSKFGLVLRDLEWFLDVFRFWWYSLKVKDFTEACLSEFLWKSELKALCATESERLLWRSKFSWCEARCRLVYVGDSENEVAGTEFIESGVVGDNERHVQDQQDLISSIESHFQNPKMVQNRRRDSFLYWARGIEPLSDSERSNYMSVLKNRLQGDSTFPGPNYSSSMVPKCFQIPRNQEYKSIQLIGCGSYKEVFKSKWLGMNVALATSKSDQAPTTDLEAEAKMLARVQHPNVVTMIGYSYDEVKQQGFLVTELMETNLESMINKATFNPWLWKLFYPFSIFETIDILLQIVEAMVHIHECGVIHRDLKPANCLCNRENDRKLYQGGTCVVKLSDLGTAEMGSKFKTPNIGTPPWMAPEIYGRIGDPERNVYTFSADVYSFGMTCYQVITGNRPFGAMRGSALRHKVCDGHRPDIPNNCADELKKLMTECWAHIAEDRPTFKDIQQRLWNFKLDCSI